MDRKITKNILDFFMKKVSFVKKTKIRENPKKVKITSLFPKKFSWSSFNIIYPLLSKQKNQKFQNTSIDIQRAYPLKLKNQTIEHYFEIHKCWAHLKQLFFHVQQRGEGRLDLNKNEINNGKYTLRQVRIHIHAFHGNTRGPLSGLGKFLKITKHAPRDFHVFIIFPHKCVFLIEFSVQWAIGPFIAILWNENKV